MKKTGVLIIILSFVILYSINFILAEVRINEVEQNPAGIDSGNEWIELYSNNFVNLDGWIIVNHKNQKKVLSQSFNGFLVINFEGQWLNNENESINLLDEKGSLIFQTPILKDSFNNEKTWSYCEGTWSLVAGSPNSQNNCPSLQNTSIQNDTDNYSDDKDLSLDLDWNSDDIKNTKKFNVKIKAYNLKDEKYDVKISIYNYKNEIISQAYNINKEWISSGEYVNNFFNNPGNRTKAAELKISEDYKNFSGDATIEIRIRKSNSSSYISKIQKNIVILNASSENTGQTEEILKNNQEIVESANKKEENLIENNIIYLGKKDSYIKKDIIKLGGESIKSEKSIIYESPNEIIKKYSIYGFVLLMIVFGVLVVYKQK